MKTRKSSASVRTEATGRRKNLTLSTINNDPNDTGEPVSKKQKIDTYQWAERHRPTCIDDFYGNVEIKKELKGMKRLNNMPGAPCIHGGPGVGKTTLALIVARELVHSDQDIDCASGRNLTDVHIHNCFLCKGVNDIRDIVKNAAHLPQFSEKRVVIFDEVQDLPAKALSILQAGLDERPQHLVYIFCLNDVTKIPEAMKQRFYPLHLKAPDADELIHIIRRICSAEQVTIPERLMEYAVHKANGNPRVAITIIQSLSYRVTALRKDGYRNKELVAMIIDED